MQADIFLCQYLIEIARSSGATFSNSASKIVTIALSLQSLSKLRIPQISMQESVHYSINSDTRLQLLFKILAIAFERFWIRLQLAERH